MKATPLIILGLLGLANVCTIAQAPVRKFPQVINRPNINVFAPYISLDGNTLMFTSDFTNDREFAVFYSIRESVNWQEPRMMPRHINSALLFAKSYALSSDGQILYVTSNRSGTIGGYDIWSIPLKSNSANDFQNFGNPINTRSHEGAPSFSPDGNTMYFMRCEVMTQQRSDNCKILVARKEPNGRWGTPMELPGHINTGNSQTPRIAADGETLLFSSNQLQPNQGGMDLYMTRLTNGTWSNPLPLSFVNTKEDDQYVSFTSAGRYLVKDTQGALKREITEFLFPDDLRPKPVMRVEGRVLSEQQKPVSAYITVTDVLRNERVYAGRADAGGNYFVYIKAGSLYEVSLDPEQDNFTFATTVIDLQQSDFPLSQRFDFTMRQVQDGDVIELHGIRFDDTGSSLHYGKTDLLQLARLIRSIPEFEVVISLMTKRAAELSLADLNAADSLQANSNPQDTGDAANRNDETTDRQKATLTQELTRLGISPDQYRVDYSESIPSNKTDSEPASVLVSIRRR